MSADEREARPLLEVHDLVKTFPGARRGLRRAAPVHAVDGVSFAVARGETFGLVGESGSGKSTLARCVLRLIEPSSGRVIFDGRDMSGLGARELRALRSRLQVVFQDTTGSLDSRMTVGALLEEPLRAHGLGDRAARRVRVGEALERVGLSETLVNRRPFALSGGQRQRVGIARALAMQPELVILDEPVSATDVSAQAQVINLFAELQRSLGLTYVLIVHDLAVAEHACDRLAVLYLGSVMELADRDALFRRPLHPYTVSLLSAVPIPDPELEARRTRIVLSGEPTPGGRPVGCPFQARCPVGRDRAVCRDERPPLRLLHPGQHVACHFPGELSPA